KTMLGFCCAAAAATSSTSGTNSASSTNQTFRIDLISALPLALNRLVAGLPVAEFAEQRLEDGDQFPLRRKAGTAARAHAFHASRERACSRARLAAELHHERLPDGQRRYVLAVRRRCPPRITGLFLFHRPQHPRDRRSCLENPWKFRGSLRERPRALAGP